MPKKQSRHFLRVFITTVFLLALLAYIGRHQEPPRRHGRTVPTSCEDLHIDARASLPLKHSSRPLWKHCSVQMSHGFPIPDPNCTPGAINPTLTVDVLRDPDFRTGCVRGEDSAQQEKAETYGWYGLEHPQNNNGQNQTCELDHLVSLELGGADTLDNIWPECGPSDAGLRERYFKQKDLVENYLARRVREGNMDLAEAQQGIAADWTQYLALAREYCSNERCR